METKTTSDLVRELNGTVCQCGKHKMAGQTFCKSCYFSLSKLLRMRLYNRIGEGYEEAYQESVKLLGSKTNGR